MHATDFWATDARKVWGKSRVRAAYIPDARNPSNHQPITPGNFLFNFFIIKPIGAYI